ncbi:MAG: hypothetical protein CMK33_01415 [Porticoccaceae bacterium]|jgi:hypothetical protein|nr:hypothetical protein [Porticoccaceae bacterium]|tara:strand:- start:4912 stop:5601 length:690 start_codon:yes stop_codon:yes gene_type:complete
MDTKLIDRAEAAHAGKLSESACEALHREIQRALRSTNAEIESLGYDGNGDPKPARAEALESGDPAELIKLEQREDQLQASSELLYFHRERVSKAITAARVKEAGPRAKEAAKRLPGAVRDLEKANQAQAAARSAVEALKSELLTARQIAEQAGIEVDGITEDTHRAMVEALGMVPRAAQAHQDPHNARINVRDLARRLIKGFRKSDPPRAMTPEQQQRELEQRGRSYLA